MATVKMIDEREYNRLKQLERQNYIQGLNIAYHTGGMPELIKFAINEWDKQQGDFHTLHDIINTYTPTHAIASPYKPTSPLDEQKAQQELENHAIETGRHVMKVELGTDGCIVDITVVIRFGQKENDISILHPDEPHIYPGPKKDFEQKVMPHIMALIKGAPTPDDIRGSMPKYISRSAFHNTVMSLTEYWYFDSTSQYFRQALDKEFDDHIKPEVEIYILSKQITNPNEKTKIVNDVRNRFTKAIKLTFAAAEKAGRGKTGVKPPPNRRGPIGS